MKKGDRFSIKHMQSIARKRGGRCLSNVYVNARVALKWKCSKGHRWWAVPYSVVNRGSWCQKCYYRSSGQDRRLGLKAMRMLASSRSGRCLSKEYINSRLPLLWQCEQKHVFKMSANAVRLRGWCAQCKRSTSEELCRIYFETIFGKPFPQDRPEWLMTSDGIGMHLDGFCKSLKLAFEHNGRQHYRKVKFFHRSENDYRLQRARDNRKRILCRDNGVRLIVIPELFVKTKLSDLTSFIYRECRREGISISKKRRSIKIDIARAFRPANMRRFSELRGICYKKGGRLISTAYLGTHVKLYFECRKKHTWHAEPNSIRQGTWCPRCAKVSASEKLKGSSRNVEKMAKQLGGRLLSKVYRNSWSKLSFECSKGHKFEKTPNAIQQEKWCPECAPNKKGRIIKMRALAARHGGKCLSSRYVNSVTPLLWECRIGHTFKKKPNAVFKGRWCDRASCFKNRERQTKITGRLEELQSIAFQRGGACLGAVYRWGKEKMSFACAYEHKWEALASSIRMGYWCRDCAHLDLTIVDKFSER